MAGIPSFRRIGEIEPLREAIQTRVAEALSTWPGFSNDQYSLKLENVRFSGPDRFDIPEQRKAILEGQTLGRPIQGEWVLRDHTGQVLAKRRMTLGTVPYLTDLGAFVIRGHKYTLAHQTRLKPGVYVRKNRQGIAQAHINIPPRQGLQHYVELDPEKGILKLRIGGSSTPLYPVLRAMGIGDDAIKAAWGKEVWQVNAGTAKANLNNFVRKVLRTKPSGDLQADLQRVRERFAQMPLDGIVVNRTLGRVYRSVTPEVWLAASRKVLAVHRGEEAPDDRDALAFKQVWGPEDLLSQVGGMLDKYLRQHFWKAIARKDLKHLPPRVVDRLIEDIIFRSGLGQELEEINPAEILDQNFRVTGMGVGGIENADSVSDEMRAVHPTQFGYMDIVRTPESEKAGVELRLAYNTHKIGTELVTELENRQGKRELLSPAAAYDQPVAVPGELRSGKPWIWAVRRGKIVLVRPEEVQYSLPSTARIFAPLTNLVVMKSGVAGQRASMGARMFSQALPIKNAEAPWVRNMEPDTGKSYEEVLAKYMGNVYAPVDGQVVAVKDDYIEIRDRDGNRHKVGIYRYFPFNRKSVHGDSFIAVRRDDGSVWFGRVKSYRFQEGDAVLSLSDQRRPVWSRIRAFTKHESDKRLFRITTRTGRTCIVTEDHSLVDWDSLQPVLPEEVVVGKTRLPVVGAPCDHASAGGKSPAREYHLGVLDGLYTTLGHHRNGKVRFEFRTSDQWHAFRKHAAAVGLSFHGAYVQAEVLSFPQDCQFPDKSPWNLVVPHLLDAHPARRFAAVVTLVQCAGAISRDAEFPLVLSLGGPHNVSFVSLLLASIGVRHVVLDPTNKIGLPPGMVWRLFRDPVLPGRVETVTAYLRENGVPQEEAPWGDCAYGDEVVRVEQVHTASEAVFDFTVEGSERFAVNQGLIVHNTYLHSRVLVRPGQEVRKGQLLAPSNFSTDDGATALGLNARVGFLPYRGLNYEDAIVVSKSFANRATSLHMYKDSLDTDKDTILGKGKYLVVYRSKFSPEQLDKLDESGVVQVGQRVRKGDPLIVALKRKQAEEGRLFKKKAVTYADQSVTWDHDLEGIVTDVVRRPDGVAVFVRAEAPLQVGDKLSGRHGNKGIVSAIIPDDKMPRDSQGRPLEVLLNPMGTPSRTNPAQLMEALLGKIAAARGKPYIVPDFEQVESLRDFVLAEAKKHGVEEMEKVYDPELDRYMPVFTGNMWFMKLHHTSESKESGRAFGAYTAEGTPAKGGKEGAKTVGVMEMNAILSHGATEVARDARQRGQASPEYWAMYMAGMKPPPLKVPLVYEKFLSTLQAAGINPVREGTKLQLMALSDKDIDQLAEGREIVNGETVDWSRNMRPIPGGLFDPRLTGGIGGDLWAFIRLPEPLPNPVMETPIRTVLGLSQKDLEAILSGKKQLYGKTGGEAILAALSKIDLDKEIAKARKEQKSSRGTARSNAIKRLSYLQAAKRLGVHPRDWIWTKVPVLPPQYRPISSLGDNKATIVADVNYLYKELLDAVQVFRDKQKYFGQADDERLLIYRAMRAVAGLGEPTHPKNRERRVKGLLEYVFGSRPKTGAVQARLISGPVDLVARGVIAPSEDMDIDHVGLPENMAWQIYKPFVVRRLVQGGLPRIQALQEVEKRSPRARKALVEETQSRPVIINRAPTLHRYGMMAAWPKLIDGHVLKVNNMTLAGFAGDFDGNCCVGNTKITLELDLDLLYTVSGGDRFLDLIGGDAMRTTADANVCVLTQDENKVIVRIKIEDFPRVGDPVKDSNGADVYQVPPGVRVLSYDHTTGQVGFYEVTCLTVEEDCPCVEVVTKRGRRVVVSDNESLAVFDPETGQLVKTTPEDAIGKLVPVVKEVPKLGGEFNFEVGYWYGLLVADGWIGERTVGYSKNDPALREAFVDIARHHIEPNFIARTYTDDKNDAKHGPSAKVHLNGKPLCQAVFNCYADDRQPGRRAALSKRLPEELLGRGSEECLWGLLCGLLEGDAHLGWNKAKQRKRPVCNLYTSSPHLRDDICYLASLLGIRTSVTTVPPRGQSQESYIICLSNVDMVKAAKQGRIRFRGEQGTTWLREFSRWEPSKDDRDIVPVPRRVAEIGMTAARSRGNNKLYNVCSKAKRDGATTRAKAAELVALLGGYELTDADRELFQQFRRTVGNDQVHWDRVDTVENAGTHVVYDITVPDTKVFATNDGLVIYDTMQIHVPASPEAVEEAINKMMPSRNLLSTANFRAHYVPRHEFLGGLYLATAKRKKGVKPAIFNTVQDALRAYARGEVSVDTPVRILQPVGV